MSTRKWAPVLLPFIVGLLGSCLDWDAIRRGCELGEVLARSYYIPIVIAAISLGRRAAVIVSLVAGGSHGFTALAWPREIQICSRSPRRSCSSAWRLTTAKLAEWLKERPVSVLLLRTSFRRNRWSGVSTRCRTPPRSRLWAVWSRPGPAVPDAGSQHRRSGLGAQDSGLPDEKRQEFVGIIRKESHRSIGCCPTFWTSRDRANRDSRPSRWRRSSTKSFRWRAPRTMDLSFLQDGHTCRFPPTPMRSRSDPPGALKPGDERGPGEPGRRARS